MPLKGHNLGLMVVTCHWVLVLSRSFKGFSIKPFRDGDLGFRWSTTSGV
jgi:hypothetical protein